MSSLSGLVFWLAMVLTGLVIDAVRLPGRILRLAAMFVPFCLSSSWTPACTACSSSHTTLKSRINGVKSGLVIMKSRRVGRPLLLVAAQVGKLGNLPQACAF